MTELLEQKSILAKLMATENITVRHAKVPTAGFDPKGRTLILPILKEMEGDVYDLFVCHEVGHALNTPANGWHKVIAKEGPNYKGFLNVVEDARIEKLIKRKFAGAGKAMSRGYKVLVHDRDFFGLKQYNIDINSSSLIDKLNIHFKGGPLENVQFTEAEKPYVDKMAQLETWEDVEQLTKELWDYAEENEEDQMTCTDDLSIEEEYEDDEDEDEEDSEEYDYEYPEEEETETDGDDIKDDSKEKRGEGEEVDSDGENEEAKAENGKKEEEKGEGGNSQSGSGGGYDKWNNEDPWKWNREPRSLTDQNFRVKEEELVHEDALDLKYYNSPDIDLKNGRLIVNYKELLKKTKEALDTRGAYLTEHNKEEEWVREQTLAFGYAREYLKYIDKENKPVVNYLVKEFEMKKRAAEYKRTMTANSGVISLSDIHKYKYCDNIFNKITIVPEGKNHGLYFLMDWSGSMSDKMMPTLVQLFQLIDFCRKCNIAHEAYAFADYNYDEDGENITEEAFGVPYKKVVGQLAIGDRATQLFELFSNKMSNKEFKAQREYLLLSILRCDRDFVNAYWLDERKAKAKWKREIEGRNVKMPVDTIPYKIFQTFGEQNQCRSSWEWNSIARAIKWPLQRLCGTPLNDAIMISTANVKRFQRENNLDIVNTVILSDGESNQSHRAFCLEEDRADDGDPDEILTKRIDTKDCGIRLVDKETKKVFEWTASHGFQQTNNFIEYYKFKTGSNVIGFFLTTHADDAGRIVGFNGGWGKWQEEKSEYNRKGYLIVEDHAYDELYVIKSHASVMMEEEIKIDNNKNNTTATLTKAFMKFRKGKLDKRIMLQRFAEKVA
jgi:hypothetical protein|tara:strand:- start:150 stop:2657 length:2508 start_codon:yes stop_codon:yes gene_type:complete